MATSAEIKQKAIALAEKTDVNSITPKEVGGIMYDIASHSENVLRNGGTLGIRKVYESVAAMEADSTNPKDFWGDPIKKGNLVVIYDGTTTGVDNNKIYAFMKPGWQLATDLDAGYATRREITDLKDYTDTKLSELESNVFIKNDYYWVGAWPKDNKIEFPVKSNSEYVIIFDWDNFDYSEVDDGSAIFWISVDGNTLCGIRKDNTTELPKQFTFKAINDGIAVMNIRSTSGTNGHIAVIDKHVTKLQSHIKEYDEEIVSFVYTGDVIVGDNITFSSGDFYITFRNLSRQSFYFEREKSFSFNAWDNVVYNKKENGIFIKSSDKLVKEDYILLRFDSQKRVFPNGVLFSTLSRKLMQPYVQFNGNVEVYEDVIQFSKGDLYVVLANGSYKAIYITDNNLKFAIEPSKSIVYRYSTNTIEMISSSQMNEIDTLLLIRTDNNVRVLNEGLMSGYILKNPIRFYKGYINWEDGKYQAKVVINATGVNGDLVNELVNNKTFDIMPRKGQYYVLDHFKHPFVNHTIFMVPSEKGKGVLISPTTSGNYLVGPSANLVSRDEKTTDKDTLISVKAQANSVVENIPYYETIRTFAGLRATPSTHDFIIEESETKNFINVVGIESPGLAASPAIAKKVVEELIAPRFNLVEKLDFNPYVKKYVKLKNLTIEEKQEYFKQNKDYGIIVCKCEQVSKGEIIDCLKRSCPPRSIKALKRRLRVGFGKCQGGMCQPYALDILADFYGVDKKEIPYDGKKAYILYKETKGGK